MPLFITFSEAHYLFITVHTTEMQNKILRFFKLFIHFDVSVIIFSFTYLFIFYLVMMDFFPIFMPGYCLHFQFYINLLLFFLFFVFYIVLLYFRKLIGDVGFIFTAACLCACPISNFCILFSIFLFTIFENFKFKFFFYTLLSVVLLTLFLMKTLCSVSWQTLL